MTIMLRTRSCDEKRSAWRRTTWSLLIGLIPLIILIFIAFPRDLWTPIGAAEFIRVFLTVALIACGSYAMAGPVIALEDYEVRTHTGNGPIVNPISSSLFCYGGLGVIACVVLLIRYIYLLIPLVNIIVFAKYTNSADLNITPGIGINKVIAIGMNSPDIRRATGGIVFENIKTGGFIASVPSLGVAWSGNNKNAGLNRIDFLIDPTGFNSNNSARRLQRFCGTLSGAISFAKPGSFTREKVVALFGEPQHAFDIRAESEISSTLNAGESVSIQSYTLNTEDLWYPKQGIGFFMRSNVVYSLPIIKKFEQSTSPLPRASDGHSEGER